MQSDPTAGLEELARRYTPDWRFAVAMRVLATMRRAERLAVRMLPDGHPIRVFQESTLHVLDRSLGREAA